MTREIAISVKNISKTFLVPHERHSSLKQSALNIFSPKKFSKLQTLKGVDLEIYQGEFFGIMGRNGCGKSTLLKILANIYQPTSGKTIVDGRLAPFIELGVGFNPELTGRENIFLSGTILGMRRKEIEDKYQDIVDFSELEEFMDQKLKNYSSGMQVRLAFSIAIQANSDILLIDEVLAVGDANFQRKCFKVFKELKKAGKTIVFVSHGPDAIRDFCDRVALIEKGKLVALGDPSEVTNKYLEILSKELASGLPQQNTGSKRWGDGNAKITKIEVLNSKGKNSKVLGEEAMKIVVEIDFIKAEENPIVGIIIKNESDIPVFQSNTIWADKRMGKVKGKKTIIWELLNYFDDGSYTITPAVAYEDGLKFYDWWENAVVFDSRKKIRTSGVVNIEHKITIK